MRYTLEKKDNSLKHLTFTRKVKFLPKASRKGGSSVVVKDKERQQQCCLKSEARPPNTLLRAIESKEKRFVLFIIKTFLLSEDPGCELLSEDFVFHFQDGSNFCSPPLPILTFSGDLSFSGGVRHLWGIDFVAYRLERSV